MKTMELRNERVEDGKTLGCVWGEVSPSLQPPTAFSATPSPKGLSPLKTPKVSREFSQENSIVSDSERPTPPILSHGFVRS